MSWTDDVGVVQFDGTIVKLDADGNEVLSSTLDEPAGEQKRGDRVGRSVAPPTNVVATNVDPDAPKGQTAVIRVDWTPPVNLAGVTGFSVHANPVGVLTVTSVGADATYCSFPDPPDPDQLFTFSVVTLTARGASRPSAPSNPMSANGGP